MIYGQPINGVYGASAVGGIGGMNYTGSSIAGTGLTRATG